MQYDIIDETSHVEYGRQWLEEIAKGAGVAEDYRARGSADRAAAQVKSDHRVSMMRKILAGHDPDPSELKPLSTAANASTPAPCQPLKNCAIPKTHAHYQWLLKELRGQQPFKSADEAPVRPNLPM